LPPPQHGRRRGLLPRRRAQARLHGRRPPRRTQGGGQDPPL
ncbi:MAG: hypothetical protein AVDCRST_MAG89-1507, partial [uncultured Gemmatimonadetes bacterium]